MADHRLDARAPFIDLYDGIIMVQARNMMPDLNGIETRREPLARNFEVSTTLTGTDRAMTKTVPARSSRPGGLDRTRSPSAFGIAWA